MSVSVEQPPEPSRSFFRPAAKGPSPQGQAAVVPRLYRVIWRWHFYAGIVVAPVLIVMAATGALYIFKEELQRVMYPDLMYVEPTTTRATIDSQLAAARDHVPPGYEITQFDDQADPTRATAFYASSDDGYCSMFVDPYRGEYLGQLGKNNFFAVVLKIHRTLFAGTLGRIVTELVTCWTIVLLVSGLYLWWPRRRRHVWGVWLPRLRRHPYVALRDLHAVSGMYAALVALLIASTGLLYTYVWGSGYRLAAVKSGAYDIFVQPPKSRSSAASPRLPLDEIVAAAAEVMPGRTLSVTLPHDPAGAFVVFGKSPLGPASDGVAVIDHATGEVIEHRAVGEYPALGWWASWNYPLHVGSVLGLTTKILWLAGCGVLMLLPITGVWMWWQRRPRGQWGFPRRPQVLIPRFLVMVIVIIALVLPVLGISIAVILLGEKLVTMLQRKGGALPPQPSAV